MNDNQFLTVAALKEMEQQRRTKRMEEESKRKGTADKTLKSCPFCGGAARYCMDQRFENKPENFPKWYVACKSCSMRTPVASLSYVQKLWNRRV